MTNDEKKRFEKMEESLSEIDGKVDEILNALKGDSMGTSKGMIKEIREMKDRVDKLEDKDRKDDQQKNKIIWSIGGIGVGLGLGAGFAIDKVVSFVLNLFK